MDQSPVIADDMVVSMAYQLTVDQEVVDASDEDDPLVFIQGYGEIIPGLERMLYGLRIGESRQVSVLAKDAYGEMDPEAVMDVPRDQFPEDIPLEIGLELQVRDSEDDVLDARIIAVDNEKIKLDFNHPLAGKDLLFDITIVDIRQATAEEIAHGHVHDDECDCDCDCDCGCDE